MQNLPSEIPVLTLPNTVFFPHTVIPLHIFEPRYRVMLRDVLRTHRVFAVATLDQDQARTEACPEPPYPFATAGVIRVCQKCDDGTSDLLLEGLARIRIDSIISEDPYRVVHASPLPDATAASAAEMRRLRRDLIKAVKMRSSMGVPLPVQVDQLFEKIADAAALCDLLLFSAVGDVAFKQRMLATTDTARRLALTTARLLHEAAQASLGRRLQGGLDDTDIVRN